MQNITREQFRDLLKEFLKDDLTRDHIVILFVFCTDIIIWLLRHKFQGCIELCQKFVQWSAEFIVDKVCGWVTKHGGWVSTADLCYVIHYGPLQMLLNGNSEIHLSVICLSICLPINCFVSI